MAVNVNGGALEFDAVINAGQFNAAITAIEKQLTALTGKAKEQASSIDNLVKKTSLAIASYATVATAKNFIGDIVRVRGEFQQLEVAFRTMLKNKGAADKLLAEATTLAAKTPFTLQEVGASAKQLLAYGFAAGDITKNIEMLGNVASGVGAPLGDIVYLYGTLRTQGRAYTKDIMQFTSRGIPIIRLLAEQFGVAETEVQGLVESGKVGFPEVERAFRSMTNEGGLFFNLMQEQSKTLTGLVSNLQDAWSRMLNDIGKSNEGAFAGAIQAAIKVVDNYQDVLDILKVLLITYGSYKAAVIATTAVQSIATSVAKGYTIAETLRYRAMLLSERAMKILNATMLSNPAVLVATGIALLVSALVILRKETDKVKTSQQLLAESQKIVGDRLAETEAKFRPYLEALKNANLSEEDRVKIYEKIKAIDPSIVKGLDAKTISYQNLAANVNLYLDSLRKQIALETNKDALTNSIKNEQELEKQIKQREAAIKSATKAGKENTLVFADNGKPTTFAKAQQSGIDILKKQLEEQKKVTKELGEEQVKTETKVQETKQRTVTVIDEEIKALKEQQSAVSSTAKQYEEFQKKINALEKEKIRITGDKKADKEAAKDYNQRLSDLKQLLSDINNAEADARQSGLLKEQSQIDQINERYDQLKERAKELNAGAGVIQRIENARVKQVGNVKEKEAFELYKRSLQDQKALFDQFEQYKLSVGEEKSKELLGIQQGDFTDYISFLQAELKKIGNSNEASTLGGKLKIQFLTDALVAAEKAKAQKVIDDQAKAYEDLLNATVTYYDRKAEIDKRYNGLYAALERERTKISEAEYAARKKKLDDQFKGEVELLKLTESEIVKSLNADFTIASRQQIEEIIKQIEEVIKSGKIKNAVGEMVDVPPEVLSRIKQAKSQLQGLLNETAVPKGLTAFLKLMSDIQSSIDELGQSLSSLGQGSNNQFLSELGSLISGLASQITNLSNVLGKIKSGDLTKGDAISAGASFLVDAVGGIINAAAERKRVAQEYYRSVLGFQNDLNLSIIEELRLRAELNESVFLTDYIGRMKDGMAAAIEANKQYQASFDALQNAQVKIGQRNKVDWGRVGQNTLSGAAAGAAIGSIVPVIGTAVGAVVGAVAGFVSGLFSRKRVDQWGGLLTEYPELIKVAANGQKELNVELAESLIKNGLVNEQTKQALENIIATKDAYAAAQEQIRSVISDLAGSLGDDIRNSLVQAFRDGEDASKAFATSVEKTLENVLSNILFNQIFADSFKELEDRMKESFDIGGDENFVDDIVAFYETYGNNAVLFSEALKAAQLEAEKKGLNLFQKTDNATTNENSLAGAIKGITEQQAQLLAGQFGGLRLTAIDQLNVAKSQLDAQQAIQVNTGLTSQRVAILLERIDYYYNNVGVKIR